MSSEVILTYDHSYANDPGKRLRIDAESWMQSVNIYVEADGATIKIGLGPQVARRLAAILNEMADQIDRDMDTSWRQSTYLRAHPSAT